MSALRSAFPADPFLCFRFSLRSLFAVVSINAVSYAVMTQDLLGDFSWLFAPVPVLTLGYAMMIAGAAICQPMACSCGLFHLLLGFVGAGLFVVGFIILMWGLMFAVFNFLMASTILAGG